MSQAICILDTENKEYQQLKQSPIYSEKQPFQACTNW